MYILYVSLSLDDTPIEYKFNDEKSLKNYLEENFPFDNELIDFLLKNKTYEDPICEYYLKLEVQE